MKSFRHFIAGLFGRHPEFLFKLNYWRVNHVWLNTKNPQHFYDKVAYLAFHTDTTVWSSLADKLKVRDYVAGKGYADNLPRLYGFWNSADKIDFDILPNQFVLKTNNASNTNLIVRDKHTLNPDEVRSRFRKWLKWNYGRETAQPHYCRIKPMILAEELLLDEDTTKKGEWLTDYKFFCFNGVPHTVHLMKDRKGNIHSVREQFYDMDWQSHPEYSNGNDEIITETVDKPVSFEIMKQMASALSEGFPFVRVDFYQINGKPVIGEMSFTPGVESFSPILSKILGDNLQL